MTNLDLLKELEDNKEEINNFINASNKTILDEQTTSQITLINQLLGHFNQILVRVQDIISKDTLEKYSNYSKDISIQIDSLEKDNTANKLISLNKIYNTLNTYYQELNSKILDTLDNNSIISDYNNLIRKANEKIVELNNKEIPLYEMENIIPLYNELKTNRDTDKLNLLISKLNTILINNLDTTTNLKKGKEDERIFSLFAKINDQIIDSTYIKIDNLVYALYTLEDNSKYYAIIKEKKEIEVLDQSFSNLPNLVLTKDNIIETCKLIIKNAGIYYDLNEYMRYIEKSYKNNITKEIDEIILKYKTRLQELENIIKVQLEFIDDIALLVNNKPCNKYPNIVYNDIKVEDYFNYNEEKDSRLKEIEHLIVNVLLNPNIKSEFDTKSILNTLYDTDTINRLLSNNYISNNIKPNLNKEDTISTDIEITNNIKTNSLKIKDYLKSRINELELLSSSPNINVTITKEDNSIFKDINTVLDLHTAIVICDKVYKKGQGNYAVIDYLKTGNTLKFTSKYKARDLASSVNRNNYLKLLLENILKRYLYQKDNNEFIESILTKDNISINDIVKSLLDDENLLIDTINNFDYDYLDSTKDKSKRLEEILNNKEDLKIVKISKILEDIKRIDKLID